MVNGIDCVFFVVADVDLESRFCIPSRREYFSRVEALDALRDRLYDDYSDAAADVTSRQAGEFREFTGLLESCYDREGSLFDVVWRGTRYWVEEHHEEGGR